MSFSTQGGKSSLDCSGCAAKATVVIVYITLNMSLNLLNKWLLSKYGFPFPIFMSLSHMAFAFVALLPVMLSVRSYREAHASMLHKHWMGFMAIGTLFAVNIAFNNISLLSISLSLNQVIRSAIPVCTAVGAVVIEARVPSRQEGGALLLLVTGVGLAVYEGSGTKSSVYGIVLCVLGTVSNGLMMASTGRLLSDKVDVARLAFYTAPVAALMLLPFCVRVEAQQLAVYHAASGAAYLWLLLLGCANALAYNLVHSLVIKVTSSVTTTVLGEMKIVLILLLSALLLGEGDVWTMRMMVGVTMAILGFCLYSHSRLYASTAAPAPVIKGIPDLGGSLSDSLRAPLLTTSTMRERN